MNRLRTFTMVAGAIVAALVSVTPSGTASAAPSSSGLAQSGSGVQVSEVYPGCEVFFDDPHVVDGKVRFNGGARCSESAPATVDWLLVWLSPQNDAPYDEAVGEGNGPEKSHSASSTVPCVDGTYQGTVFASVFGNKGVDQMWVDREVTVDC
ncbi:hypothetical protein ABT340_31535 [Streptosporangium sp. NPDC000239]|uniref:hypothetical protein n=1 Tax=Streptosporangium sp. NPDC000239 TaxID=3154248 RepID=UPI0033188D68